MDTYHMMGIDMFWQLIEQSRTNLAFNYEEQQLAMIEILKQLDSNEIIAFENRMRFMSSEIYRADLWAAAFIINGGCSDGAFDDFRTWLMSKGKITYTKVLHNPEELVNVDFATFEDDFEGFGYVCYAAYQEKFGKELESSYLPELKLKGELWDEDSEDELENLFPKLYKKYE